MKRSVSKRKKNRTAKVFLGLIPYLYRIGNVALGLTRLPLMGKAGHKLLDTEHSNVTYIPIDADLEMPETTVTPITIVEHFIRKSSHRFQMAYCPCRTANDCKDFPQDVGCIWVGPATEDLDLPPEIGRHVSVEEALEHLHRARNAGLITVLGKFKPDAVAMGVGNDDKRFMTLCNCCSCCCMVKFLPKGRREYTDIIHRIQGLTVRVDTNLCMGCKECTKVCMFENIAVIDGKARIHDDCKGCGFCANACPNHAIRITIDDPTFIEEAIGRITKAVEVST